MTFRHKSNGFLPKEAELSHCSRPKVMGDASCFNLEFGMSLMRTNRVRALYISLPMHSWNEVSGSAQQLRSVERVRGENGLSLESCQMLRSVRVSSVPSLWQLSELSWVINNESFGKIMVDHCAFGIARRRWRVPLTLLYTSLPSLNEVVECCPSRFRCQGGHQHHAINLLTSGDAEYIPNEVRSTRALCLFGDWSLFRS